MTIAIAQIQTQVAELAEIFGADSPEVALIQRAVLFFLGRLPLAAPLRPQQVGEQCCICLGRQLLQRVPKDFAQIRLG